MRDAERERQYEEYKDRIGEIVHGVVKRVEYGTVVVDLGRGEAIVRRDEMIPRETFRPGDRIRAYIYRRAPRKPRPADLLSRSHPQFMARLFAQEVPEIYDGIIKIRAVARDPGSRAKIAVISRDSFIDPVGACVPEGAGALPTYSPLFVGWLVAGGAFRRRTEFYSGAGARTDCGTTEDASAALTRLL